MQTSDRCRKVLFTSLFCGVAVYFLIAQKVHQHGTGSSFTSERPDLSTDLVNPHPYSFILNKPNLCKTADGENPVVILVPSASTNFLQRKAIRVTWGKDSLHLGFKLAFLLGYPKNSAVQPMILAEDRLFHDVIQEDFTDVYHNLPIKSVMMVRWVKEHCSNAQFVLKIDDDMLLNVWGLWAEIETSLTGANLTIWGKLAQHWTPFRNSVSKWYLPVRVYKKPVFPDFLAGPAYLFTGDCAPVLYNVSFTVPYLPLEDVFLTGVVAQKAGITRKNHPGFFNYRKILHACAEPRQIASHGYRPISLIGLWGSLSLKNGHTKCKIRHSAQNVTKVASAPSVSS
ncbi:beta-1,3-galactosyltransferase 1-like [Ornithodoros turicata]|uniref:beta-1,3-galactosyltransferase 1-like n=1 Tax=Ornithodoros turicata TaxID=34597 RepID=UPI00313A08EC